MQLLRRIGLEEKAQEYPDRLSGGQQQRVAIVRALAMEPQLLLLDEITSALDPELVAEVLNIVRQLAEEGMTMVIATHEMGFAREVATKVCFLHEGVVHEEGPPQQLFGDPQRRADAGVPAAHHRGRPALRGHTLGDSADVPGRQLRLVLVIVTPAAGAGRCSASRRALVVTVIVVPVVLVVVVTCWRWGNRRSACRSAGSDRCQTELAARPRCRLWWPTSPG